jgi:xylose dehydrogenase (NAD/NADP)
MMTAPLRWGLLSTAGINRALIGPLKTSARSELVAVASRDGAQAQAYAQEWGIPRAFAGYDALLADPNIDVIYNPLPNTMHAEWTIKAAAAGKHVLCEKPIVTTLAELDRVAAAAKQYGVVIFEAFMYLHHPQMRRLQSLIQEGALGEVSMVNGWFHFYLPPERSNNIRLNPKLAGGSLWDVGVYPNSAAIDATQTVGETGVDVLMHAQLRYPSGAVAQISSGLRQPGRGRLIVVGDEGEAQLPVPWKPDLDGPNGIELTRRNGPAETLTFDPIDPYLCEVNAMEACVLDGADPIVPLSLSREFLTSVLGIYGAAGREA